VAEKLHEVAATGYARGAEDYERGRSGYPQEAVDWLDLRAGRTVVDLAAGTGKFTRLLVPTGARVIAVEPVAEMRALIRGPVEVLDGTAEAMPLQDSSVDVVTVAQAFHWFDPEPALAEIRRVLRPGGTLALVWNRRIDEDPLNKAIREITEPYRGDAPDRRDAPWRALLEPSEEREFDNPHLVEAGMLGERVASISFISALPDEERQRVVAAAEELARGRAVTIPQRTLVQLFRLGTC
jgi:SAM-dependent methyltransferase